jgi:sortase A
MSIAAAADPTSEAVPTSEAGPTPETDPTPETGPTSETGPTPRAPEHVAQQASRSVLRTVVGVSVLALGALAAAFVGFVSVGSALPQSRAQDVLYADFRSDLAHGTAPVSAPVATGTAVAVLTVPRLGLRQVVVEGSASRQLMRGPGHVGGTPLPGQPGVSVLLGRRSSFGAPFRHLDRLVPGDLISVVTGQGRFTYKVDESWRSDLTHVAPPAAAARLTLVTGDPAYTPHRSLVVTAALQGQAAPAGAVTAAQADASPLAVDHSAGFVAYMWAQALLLLAVATAFAWRRLPRAVVWIGALPLCLVVVWNLFENVAALLPNTL